MRALTWQGHEDLRVETVPDSSIIDSTDAIIRVTSTAICGSDLHLYSVLGASLDPGDILGHEAMGVVEEVGAQAGDLSVGDRVVVPDDGEPDERYLYLSDVLPTAWQAVEYGAVPRDGSVVVVGLGPIGQMAARIARHHGARTVIGIDSVPERLAMAARHGIDTIDSNDVDDLVSAVRDRTAGRGADTAIDAVGMEAHGSPIAHAGHQVVSRLPDAIAEPLVEHAAVDRLDALRTHRVALEDAPAAYEMFQRKDDGCIKVVLDPAMAGTAPRDDADAQERL